MHSRAVRTQALRLLHAGHSTRSISKQLGVSRSSVREWAEDPARATEPRVDDRCFVCSGQECETPEAYGYLLGQYLGDGYLVASARVPRLRIACANDYPIIAASVDEAMRILCGNRPGRVQAIGCTDRYTSWMHWPCLLPQHGPGRKHTRPIVLSDWQQTIVTAHPWPLIRGLLHSDGCRSLNRVVINQKAYCYPRYFFANESRDILAIMGDALDRVGVAWRYNNVNSISVARREAVAVLDHHVGPKC